MGGRRGRGGVSMVLLRDFQLPHDAVETVKKMLLWPRKANGEVDLEKVDIAWYIFNMDV